ncbi:MAG: TIGR02147 family protein [Bdellovibrionales bacterium]
MTVLESRSYLDFLNAELERRITQNRSYSLRAFARDLRLSPGELSEIIRGKRKLTTKASLKISNALGLSHIEEKHLIGLALEKESAQVLTKEELDREKKKVLNLEYFKVIENWYHFAILNLSECKNFKWNVKLIGKRLGLSTIEVKIAIDRLLKIGLLRYDRAKVYVVEDFVETPTDIPSSSVRTYHRQMIEKAKIALDEQRPEDRDISGIGFAVDPKQVPAMKREIREFQDTLIAKYSKGEKTEVYQLETLLFKLSRDGE